jgi:hypothetical protein
MSGLENRIIQKTKRLRTTSTSSPQYEQHIDYLLRAIPYIKHCQEQQNDDDDDEEESRGEDMSTSPPTNSTAAGASPKHTIESFVDVAPQHSKHLYDEYLATVEGNKDALSRVAARMSYGDDVLLPTQHPNLRDAHTRKLSRKQLVHAIRAKYVDDDICDACGERCVLNTTESMCVCTGCGACYHYIEGSTRNLSYTEELELGNKKAFTYKRISHFCETLASVQGNQRTNIPDSVIEGVCAEIKKHRLSLDQVTPKHIRDFLKRLGHPKYYEANNYILNTIRGGQQVVIPKDIEERLIRMFIQIQKPFDDVSEKGRKNFLRYHFIIYKFLQLMGDEGEPYLHLFPLLKSTSKLAQHDAVWKRICECVGFEFIPTI